MTRLRLQEHGLTVKSAYAVAPHHAGVYPVHSPLYAAWDAVWGIRVTSTEEYPHFKPAAKRRGFVHRGLAVLPRQTCGLYTKTVLLEDFQGGPAALESSVLGGELFFTFLLNPFLLFMTHSNNYAKERLALYLFETQLRVLACWTNLKFDYRPPQEMAKAYFEAYPSEMEPVWGNPCLDRRHLAIWAPDKPCHRFPKALILGPQKTGSTALHAFLALHPLAQPSEALPESFEEPQFFSGRNYRRGIDWYSQLFTPPGAADERDVVYFEKSATYFDSEAAPKRAAALVPEAKLVAILTSPARRAYSWYQVRLLSPPLLPSHY